MIIEYISPYYNMLIELMKDDELPDDEQNIFDALLHANSFLNRQDLVNIVFGKDPDRTRAENRKLIVRIREGVEYLQDRAVPISILHGGRHRLGNNMDLIKYTIDKLERDIRRMQERVNTMRFYYDRQLKLFEKVKGK